ncbi:MAG: hypothetical protein EGP89_02640, partial [Ruminococcaceae bacterium]|nr:hypothetical protein [Oscillospiraceae bacterium]
FVLKKRFRLFGADVPALASAILQAQQEFLPLAFLPYRGKKKLEAGKYRPIENARYAAKQNRRVSVWTRGETFNR